MSSRPPSKGIFSFLSNRAGWRFFYLFSIVVTSCTFLFLASLENFNPSRLETVFTLFFLLHLARRSYETLFIQRLSPNPMPFIHIVAGTGYYFTVPIATLVEIHDLFEYHGGVRTFSLSTEGAFLTFIGSVLFFIGNALQFQSHYLLASLRPSSSSRNFAIPRGGLFTWVSCPHYLAEIIIYISFLFITQFQIINLWYTFLISYSHMLQISSILISPFTIPPIVTFPFPFHVPPHFPP